MAFREIFGIAKESAVLPAAGVYDPSPLGIACNQYKEASFKVSYTRGGAGGAVTYKIEFSDDGLKWFQVCEVQKPNVVTGTDVVDLTQRAEIKYGSTGATIERFMTPTFAVSGQFIRIVMKESGAVGTPGTAAAKYFFQGDS